MPGLTPWDFVPPTSPISLRSANRLGKMKSSLTKYWTDPDKYIAFVMAGTGILFACFGSVLFSIGIGLPIACYLSYKRSNSDIYTNSRVVLHDLLKFPKYAGQVLAMLKSAQQEQLFLNTDTKEDFTTSNQRAISQPAAKVETNEESESAKNDIFTSSIDKIQFKTAFAGDNMFPLNIVLLAKPLNPNMKMSVQVVGYLCVDFIDRICSEDVQKHVEMLLANRHLEPKVFQAEIEKLGVHYDLLKRERKDLFAYTFGTACILKTIVIKPEFRGNNLGQVLFAYAMQKLRKMSVIDVLICRRDAYVEHALMDKFYGRYYTPPDFCTVNENLHQALRRETIFFPIYKHKLDHACDIALEKFFTFEKLKKNTIPYFTKDSCSNYCLEEREASVEIVGPSNRGIEDSSSSTSAIKHDNSVYSSLQ